MEHYKKLTLQKGIHCFKYSYLSCNYGNALRPTSNLSGLGNLVAWGMLENAFGMTPV